MASIDATTGSATNQPPKTQNQALPSRPKEFCNRILSKADVVRLVGHVQRMSQADNAAPNSIVVMDFTGSFATLAPRNDSMPLTHRQSTTGDLPVVPMCRS